MVIFVRAALLKTVLALAVAVSMPAAFAQAANRNPSPRQIRRAISRAERSKSLWATVNICNSRRQRNTIGIRGQMPTLGFPAWLSMRIELGFYNKTKKRFDPVSSTVKLIRLGRSSTGLVQDGTTFMFTPHTGLFNANVQFIWRRSGKLLGQTRRRTTAGHHDADFGSPPHFSAKQCRI
jgi:hypothetical protein